MHTVVFWGTGLENRADASDPDAIRRVSDAWDRDLASLGPWQRTFLPGEGEASQCWVPEGPTQGPPLILTGPCASTMDLARYFAGTGLLPPGGSVLAFCQWAGRGQLGRQWESPAGNIYGTCRLANPTGPWAKRFSLVVGVLVAEFFGARGIDVQIKWPNDILVKERKVGGILVEEREEMLLVGMGLNLVSSPAPALLRPEAALPAAALADFGYRFTPVALWHSLMVFLKVRLAQTLEQDTPGRLLTRMRTHLAFVGRQVRVTDPENRIFEATLTGLSPDGELLLSTDNQTTILRSGSFLPLPGPTLKEAAIERKDI